MPSSATYDVNLTTLAYGGEAMGRLPDGRAVFVPFGLPGEIARVRLVDERRGFARAELVEILAPSPERIAPLCRHFGTCGGCHYQHLPYADQLNVKTTILKDQLVRIGKLENIPIQPIVPSPESFYYRNHIQFHLTRDGKLGFYAMRSQDVMAIQECHLPEETLNVIWPQLDFEPEVDSEPLEDLERIGLRVGLDDVQLILESGDIQAPELSVEELTLSAVHLSPAGALVMAGRDHVFIEVSGRSFQVSAGSFFQVNTAVAEKMVEHLLQNLVLKPDMTVIDVYCGVGLFSAFLAPRVGRLVGVESSSSAADDFVENLDEFENVTLYEGPAEEVLPALDLQPDVVLVDPPRSGLEPRALDGLLALKPPVLVYISCDPATLGRDAKRLVAAGYNLKQITPFDLFPQTYHIESISFWGFQDFTAGE
jgi:23S rRNA (uracil1939-C5)-methyltransferase